MKGNLVVNFCLNKNGIKTKLKLNRNVLVNLFSTSRKEQLTRDYIQDSLYDCRKGYFVLEERGEILHSPRQAMDFQNLWGKWEYKYKVKQMYETEREAWMTPVEVFYPHYSNALAKFILNSPHNRVPLTIYEIGGGSGTNALCILDYVKKNAPEIYEKMSYTIIEISSRMSERQRMTLDGHPNATVINQDFLTYNEQFNPVQENCFVLAMEVLDNLPHDKVTLQDGKWFETVVQIDEMGACEKNRPLQDKLILQTMDYFSCELPLSVKYRYNSGIARKLRKLLIEDKVLSSSFIPTGAMKFLNVLTSHFPNHHLIAADFDELSSPVFSKNCTTKLMYHPNSPTSTCTGPLASFNAPLVASKTTGKTVDHDTYLVSGGISDIFFPTNFLKFKSAYCRKTKRNLENVSVVKSSVFMKEFADLDETKTMLGYNPLIDDYENTSFILS